MQRTNADIKFKKPSRVEKAVLISSQLKIDFDEFDVRFTAYVPKADIRKPKPKVAVTLDVASDKIRAVSGSVDDLIDLFGGIAVWLSDNRKLLNDTVEKEANIWLQKHIESQSIREAKRLKAI